MDSNVNPNRNEKSEEEKTPQDYLRQIKENYPDLKQNLAMNVFQDRDGEDKTITVEDLIQRKANAFYFKGCKKSTFKFARNVTAVKIMIEHCDDCTFLLQGPITTTVVEVWRCNNASVTIDTQVNTLQVDLNNNLTVTYTHKAFLGSIVQAGVHGFHLKFEDHPELNLETGYDELVKETPEINDQTDQFITRFIEGNLLTEEIIRYADGYHTTEREKAAKLEEAVRNAGKEEEAIRDMLKFSEPILKENAALEKKDTEDLELEKKSNLKKAAGNKAYIKGKYDEAIAAYTAAMEFTPNNHVLYSNRAAVYIDMGKLDEALADADKCIELDPAFPKGYYRRGIVLKASNDMPGAVKAFQEAHDLAPREEEFKTLLDQAKASL